MHDKEYLVSYGRAGDFSRFRPAMPLECSRGERVVVRTDQGLELGTILCQAGPGHARYLSRTAQGELLRCATPDDEQAAARMQERGDAIFDDARRRARELELPLEVVDVEVLLDGSQAILHHLRREDCDYRPLVSALSRAFAIRIVMQNLVLPVEAHEEHEGGCGKPDCGNGGGGCSTCGTGGGCSSCGAGVKKEDVGTYLASLSDPLAAHPRVPLL